jgi:hypothetical protein
VSGLMTWAEANNLAHHMLMTNPPGLMIEVQPA